MLDRAAGQSRASDAASACQLPRAHKLCRHFEHDAGGAHPGAWRADGLSSLAGRYAVTSQVCTDRRAGGAAADRGRPVCVNRVCVDLRGGDAEADGAGGGGAVAGAAPPAHPAGWQMPRPRLACFMAERPTAAPGEWRACLEPFVPRNMSCWWMANARP
jgi:hypothetical protein